MEIMAEAHETKMVPRLSDPHPIKVVGSINVNPKTMSSSIKKIIKRKKATISF
jgi:hypothetical protein